MRQKKIEVIEYDFAWSHQFEELSQMLKLHLAGNILAIEHVGSTSVKGLKAKPIIDLDIVVEDNEDIMTEVIRQLGELGYVHRGDLGIAGREAFKRPGEQIPKTKEGRTWFVHHLYVCKAGNLALQNHLLFRDYLRNHPDEVFAYGVLKQALAEKFPYNIDAYIDGKTDFIIRILSKAGLDEANNHVIREQNKLT